MADTYGFELLREAHIAELNTTARLYRHQATGAELLSLINDDENKVFGITFRTPPTDSSGIAHILEHAVLCGSRKYPVKKPFVELVKGSLNTFVNAMTYSDKTVYPVASTNTKDFYNLVDVYLDAVLHPRITPDILQQEGWHYELDEDGSLAYRGVVFNEMKGANASPERVLYVAGQSSLFPDHPVYRVDSGGDPAVIPNLTYEQFRGFHEAYYHPSNARLYFYGDDDPEQRLRLLAGYLAGFERRAVDSQIPLQLAFEAPRRSRHPYPAGQESGKHMVTVSWLLAEPPDPELSLALDVLEHILAGTPASPLRKALIDSGLGENITSTGFAPLRQTYFTSGLKGVAAEDVDAVEALIERTLAELARDGIDPQTIEASLNTVEFQLRENNTGSYPRGLGLLLHTLNRWLYDGDPLAALAFERPLAALRARLAAEPRFFEGLIERLILRNAHRSTVVLVPDAELAARQVATERERLAGVRAGLGADEIERIEQTAARLRQIQETPDSPEALASLPSLAIGDLERQITTIPTELVEIDGTSTLYHELFTNGIVYLDVGMNLRALPQEYLPYVGLFGRALLETGTGDEDIVALSQRIGRTTGGIASTTLTSAVRGKSAGVAWLFLRGKATTAQAGELLAILRDVLRGARLDNRERFRQIVLEEKAAREAGLVPAGHVVVNTRLRAQLSEADWVAEQIGGVSYLQFLRRLAAAVESDWATVQAVLEQIRARLVGRTGMLLNVTTDAASWARFQPQLAELLGRLPAGGAPPASWEPRPGGSEGLIIPANVNYVAKGADLYRLGYALHGSALVINKYLRTTWLWEQIREQGGAYGGFSIFDPRSGVFSFVSYRDPNLLRSLDAYDRTGEFLRGLELNERERTRAIIGTIADLDAYQLPDAKGYTALVRYLTGDDDAYRQRVRDEVLGTSGDDFRAFADVLDQVREAGTVVAMGGAPAVEGAVGERPGLFGEVTRVV